jgi:hypothetical protein
VNNVPWTIARTYFFLLRIYQRIHNFFIPLFKKRHEQKVFCIGFFKTGTTSLDKAMNILGYRTVHFLRTGKEPKEGWIELFKRYNYDSISDAPINHPKFFMKLDNEFPNSKYILTLRNSKSFIRSYENFVRGSPYHIKDENDKNLRLHRFETHNKLVKEYFKDRPDDLLILDIIGGEGWEKLCKFLNKPIPTKPFPSKNKGRVKK